MSLFHDLGDESLYFDSFEGHLKGLRKHQVSWRIRSTDKWLSASNRLLFSSLSLSLAAQSRNSFFSQQVRRAETLFPIFLFPIRRCMYLCWKPIGKSSHRSALQLSIPSDQIAFVSQICLKASLSLSFSLSVALTFFHFSSTLPFSRFPMIYYNI